MDSEPGAHADVLTGRTRGLLVVAVLLAALLRFWGINFGLPYFYHPDEPAVIQAAQHVFKTGDMNPRNLLYPGIVFYLNALAYVPYYVAGRAAGVFHARADIAAPVMLAMAVGRTDMPTSVVLGRGLTAVFGVGAIVLAQAQGLFDRLGFLCYTLDRKCQQLTVTLVSVTARKGELMLSEVLSWSKSTK